MLVAIFGSVKVELPVKFLKVGIVSSVELM
jgi:hypothetical protein